MSFLADITERQQELMTGIRHAATQAVLCQDARVCQNISHALMYFHDFGELWIVSAVLANPSTGHRVGRPQVSCGVPARTPVEACMMCYLE